MRCLKQSISFPQIQPACNQAILTMGHLGRYVMRNVSLANSVEDVSPNRSQKGTINGRKGAPGKCPFVGCVMS